jgi:hypothetical protein
MALRNIPSIDEMLNDARVQELSRACTREVLTEMLRQVVDGIRQQLRESSEERSREELSNVIWAQLRHTMERQCQGSLVRVI